MRTNEAVAVQAVPILLGEGDMRRRIPILTPWKPAEKIERRLQRDEFAAGSDIRIGSFTAPVSVIGDDFILAAPLTWVSL